MANEKSAALNDQSFDESELQDIMNEIESLEQDFAGAAQSPKEKADETVDTELAVAEVMAEDMDADSEEFSEDDLNSESLAEIDDFLAEQKMVPDEVEASDNPTEATVEPLRPTAAAKNSGPMSLNIQGDMAFNLTLPVEGQEVQLTVNGPSIVLAMVDVTVEVSAKGMDIALPQGNMSFPASALLQKKAA